jgi:hypothetical protein
MANTIYPYSSIYQLQPLLSSEQTLSLDLILNPACSLSLTVTHIGYDQSTPQKYKYIQVIISHTDEST